MNITYFLNKIKSPLGKGEGSPLLPKNTLILVFTALLLAGASFYLGYVAHKETATESSPVLIQCPEEAYMPKISGSASSSGVSLPGVILGAYVASKNGSKYYPPSCNGASRINEANKVWFTSEVEAQKAGYTRASGCIWQ